MSNELESIDIEQRIESFLDGSLNEEDAALLWKSIEKDPTWGDRFFEEHRNDFPLRFLAKLDRDNLVSNVPLSTFHLTPPMGYDYTEEARMLSKLALIPSISQEWENDAEDPADMISPKLDVPEKKPKSRFSAGPLIPVPLLVLLLLAIFFPLVYLEWRPRPTAPFQLPPQPSTPAVVTGMSDLRWTGKGEAPKAGEALFPGALRFEAGTLELLFQNGVRAVVEGPADLVLMNDFEVFCRKGRWSVTVPRQGSGFEIQTQSLTIRDIGTRFFAEIDPKQAEVHVLKGVVELEQAQHEKTILETGQAQKFRYGESFSPLTFSADHFIDRDAMRRRFDAFLDGIWNWKSPELTTEMKKGAVCDVRFKDGAARDATISSGVWTMGRTDDSQAFRFDNQEARIRVKPLGTHPALTAVAWFRVDRLNDELNPILMSEGSGQGGVVWHISPRGTLLVGLRRQAARGTETVETPVVFPEDRLGRWVQLALCLDDLKKRIEVYVDGDPVYSVSVASFPPLDLDALDIGNWRPQAGKQNNVRHLSGAVEQLTVFPRVLTLPEIRNLFFNSTTENRENGETFNEYLTNP